MEIQRSDLVKNIESSLLSNLTPEVIEYLNSINVRRVYKLKEEKGGLTLGQAFTKKDIIYLYDASGVHTLFHEYGHKVYTRFFEKKYHYAILSIYSYEVDKLCSYKGSGYFTAISEFFAEGFSLCVIHPATALKIIPRLYKFLVNNGILLSSPEEINRCQAFIAKEKSFSIALKEQYPKGQLDILKLMSLYNYDVDLALMYKVSLKIKNSVWEYGLKFIHEIAPIFKSDKGVICEIHRDKWLSLNTEDKLITLLFLSGQFINMLPEITQEMGNNLRADAPMLDVIKYYVNSKYGSYDTELNLYRYIIEHLRVCQAKTAASKLKLHPEDFVISELKDRLSEEYINGILLIMLHVKDYLEDIDNEVTERLNTIKRRHRRKLNKKHKNS